MSDSGSDWDVPSNDSDSDAPTRRAAPPKPRARRKAASTLGGYNEQKTIEQIYQKKTQLEHILLRPDTYIGSVQPIEAPMWVLASESSSMELRNITYVPGFFKIFDEILVNAADNKIRDPSMNLLKVELDPEKNLISVMNNGKGIPIVVHKGEGLYVPELIFGHLLTSSNYNDDDKKVTGGRNGYGAKLCNIFSNEFIVETADRSTNKVFKQVFKNNMSSRGEPKITENKRDEEYTKITFRPDLSKFNMTELDENIVALLKKRVYDLAGCSDGVRVFLNGERIKIKNFKDYVSLYVPDTIVLHERVNDRWEIAIAVSNDGQFNQMSFVNSICTSKGGTHVDYIATQVVHGLQEAIKKKIKSVNLKPGQIKNFLWVFVNCLIENPTFDSQTKEILTLRSSAFGSKCQLSDDMIKKFVSRTNVMELIMSLANSKLNKMLQKTDGRKVNRISGIHKLEDANNAGTKAGSRCTLILTEGDSAKTFAISGLGVVGRQDYGVFPLRGKLLNVRDAQTKTTADNQEIEFITKILGLQHKKVYEDTSALRYGHLMIMTDQDHDGSHIKGLIINFLDHFWPSLLKIPGFLCEFITPIVKCQKGNKQVSFFTIPEYENWRETVPQKGWHIKYYKGLGTSTTEEAKEYFSDLPKHKKTFQRATDIDRQNIDMAFNKTKADMRKQWLAAHVPGTYIDNSQPTINISDFINKELVLFSIADNQRSIPCVLDGVKPGQRKILFACFKVRMRREIKVVQLAGFVAGKAAYHHGEMSLCSTIVNMAQNFLGSNNINLLEPRGQFGSRLCGGADASSPRYIHTLPSPVARMIYHPDDDALLNYLTDDGLSIEPEWYVPVIPMVLVNGASGIGTGWSTSIPSFNPADIIDNLRRMIRGGKPKQMHPWHRGFTGKIDQVSEDKYLVSGSYELEDSETLWITELPVGTWTTQYKKMLDEAIEKNKNLLKSFKQFHAETTVEFELKLTDEQMRLAKQEGIEKRFKLTSYISTTNMVCFDDQGRIRKYSSVQQILEDFYELRLKFYFKRKDHLVDCMRADHLKISNKLRFIREVVDRKLIIEKKKKRVLVGELRDRKYDEIHPVVVTKQTDFDPTPQIGEASDSERENAENEKDGPMSDPLSATKGYDYLLNMPLYSLTEERIQALEEEQARKMQEITDFLKLTPEDLWLRDLDAIEHKLEEIEAKRCENEAKSLAKAKKSNISTRPRPAQKRRPKPATDSQSDEEYLAPKRMKKESKPAKPTTSSSTKLLAKGKIEPTKPHAEKTAFDLIGFSKAKSVSDSAPIKSAVVPSSKPAGSSILRKKYSSIIISSDDEEDLATRMARQKKVAITKVASDPTYSDDM